MFPTSNRDVTRFPLLMFVIPVSPLSDRSQAGRCTLVISPEDASVIDDGVGAPVSVVIDVEEQSRAVHVDLKTWAPFCSSSLGWYSPRY